MPFTRKSTFSWGLFLCHTMYTMYSDFYESVGVDCHYCCRLNIFVDSNRLMPVMLNVRINNNMKCVCYDDSFVV